MSGPVRLYRALPARGAGGKPLSIAVGADTNRLCERPTAVIDDLEDDALSLAK